MAAGIEDQVAALDHRLGDDVAAAAGDLAPTQQRANALDQQPLRRTAS